MKKSLRWKGIQILTAAIAALAVVSLGIRANVSWADEPGGEDIEVPAPAPRPAPAPPPPPPPAADEDNFHLYISGNVGGAFTKGRASGSIAGWPNHGSDRDADVFGGGALGIQWVGDPVGVRFEIEGQAARGADLETDWGPAGFLTMHTNVNTWAMFGNIWVDFPITETVSVFGGGGMGVAVTDITSNILSPPAGFYSDKSRDDTTWAWQTGGGISIAATDWLTFDTSYRFVDLGEPDLRFRAGAFPSDVEMHLQSHDVMLGVRMHFLSF